MKTPALGILLSLAAAATSVEAAYQFVSDGGTFVDLELNGVPATFHMSPSTGGKPAFDGADLGTFSLADGDALFLSGFTNETLESQAGSYRPPPGLSPSKQWEIAYDGANTVRVQFILWKAHGRVVNFVVNVQVITAEGWTSVERFDCCHGNCHLHPDGADSARVVLRLDSIDDVQRAFDKVRAEAEHRARIIRGKGE